MIRIPSDAFERYIGMGPERSYRALAKELHVSKRSIAKCASREGWPARLAKIDEESRARSDVRLGEALDEMRNRHLRSIRAIQGRALEALKNFPLNSATEAVSALEKGIKLERLIMGEPSERGELAVAEVTKRELDTLLIADDDEDEDDDESEPESQAG